MGRTLPAALAGRVIATSSFDPSRCIFLLVHRQTNASVELQVVAPGLEGKQYAALVARIAERLKVALVGLDALLFLDVVIPEPDLITVMLNSATDSAESPDDIVLAAAKVAALSTTEYATDWNVYTLRAWQYLLVVDWDVLPERHGPGFELIVPEGTGLDTIVSRDRIANLVSLMTDPEIYVDVTAHISGVTHVHIWSNVRHPILPGTALELIERLLFIIGKVARPKSIFDHAVVHLLRPLELPLSDRR